MTCRTAVGLALLALLTGEAAAQGAESSWEELVRSGRLRWGNKVVVNGFNGVVSDLTPDSMAIATGERTMTWAAADVRGIRTRDPLSNGAWLGAGAGSGTMAALSYALYDDEGGSYMMLYFGLPLTGLAAVFGAIVDGHIQETVFRARGSARVSLSPMLTKNGAGARMSVGW